VVIGKSELLGDRSGLDGGGSGGGRSIDSHNVVLSGSLAIQKLFFSSL
jgi:hypothetical protein